MSEQDLETDILAVRRRRLASLFLKHNLIDLVELAVVPVVLGEGEPLFADAGAAHLRHTSSQPIGLGVVVNSYRRMEAPIRRRAGRRS